MALGQSQASLHCTPKAALYALGMPTLGKRIYRARKRLDLTQDELGQVFGITGQAVSQWERDKERPDPAKLPKLRNALKVTYSWLLEGSGEPPSPDDPAVALDSLTEAQQEAVAAYIQTLQRRGGQAA